jgi:hypothetical protein
MFANALKTRVTGGSRLRAGAADPAAGTPRHRMTSRMQASRARMIMAEFDRCGLFV